MAYLEFHGDMVYWLTWVSGEWMVYTTEDGWTTDTKCQSEGPFYTIYLA